MPSLKNTSTSYGVISKLLHWLIAVLMLGLIWLGWYLVDLDYYHRWYHDSLVTHRSLGVVVLLLVICSLLWHYLSPLPKLIDSLSMVEKRLARLMHWLLMLAALYLPVSGYVISSSDGTPVLLFAGIELPALFAVSDALRDFAIASHLYVAYAVLVLAMGHALAALKHHFINRDNTLKRML